MKPETKVEVHALPPAQIVRGVRHQPEPYLLDPQPVRLVAGKFGSDDAKRNAREVITAAGYNVRFVNYTDKGVLQVIVDEQQTAPRRPRSARSRR